MKKNCFMYKMAVGSYKQMHTRCGWHDITVNTQLYTHKCRLNDARITVIIPISHVVCADCWTVYFMQHNAAISRRNHHTHLCSYITAPRYNVVLHTAISLMHCLLAQVVNLTTNRCIQHNRVGTQYNSFKVPGLDWFFSETDMAMFTL